MPTAIATMWRRGRERRSAMKGAKRKEKDGQTDRERERGGERKGGRNCSEIEIDIASTKSSSRRIASRIGEINSRRSSLTKIEIIRVAH